MGLLGIDFRFPKWEGAFEQRLHELQLFIAAQMQTNRGMLFDKSGDYNGHTKWPDLVLRNGQPLKMRGTLSQSMGPKNDGSRPGQGPDSIMKITEDTITIGTKLAYARMMNDGTTRMPGGVLRPVHAKALKIPIPSGKAATEGAKGLRKSEGNFIFRKSVKIPARPFDNWTEEDEVELAQAVEVKLKEIFDGL